MKKKFSKSSIFLLLAAAVLIGFGGIGAAWAAAPAIQSRDYRAWFNLNHLQVHLLENGHDVCGGHNDLNGAAKVTGRLLSTDHDSAIGYESKSALGSIEPGRTYPEVIAAQNGKDIPIFLRLTVRKYWIDTETGEKVTNLSPNRIRLGYSKNNKNKNAWENYNSGAWQLNRSEMTTESATYYYSSTLGSDAVTEPLFDELLIDPEVAEIADVKTRTEGSKTIYTYIYRYDGYAFFIEADVQAIQTHNINEAIKSQWGVTNVTADFSPSDPADGIESGTGSLSVGN